MTAALAPTLFVLDVGHGNCAVITDGRHVVLVDAGPGAAVLEFLKRVGLTNIDCVVLSHADRDHIKGLVALLGASEFKVAHIMLNSDAQKTSEIWRSLAYEIDELRRAGKVKFDVQLREGDVIAPDMEGITLRVVAPRDRLVMTGPGAKDDQGRRLSSNSVSAVLMVEADGRRVALLAGDLDETGYDHLEDTHQDLHAEILIFPHHGGLAGSGDAALEAFAHRFVSTVSPDRVVISLGRGSYDTPRPAVVAGIRSGAPDAHIACTQLSKRCADLVPAHPGNHLLALYSAGYSSRQCCAGTLSVSLGSGVEVLPGVLDHSAFIMNHAPTALCRVGVTPVASSS